MRTRQREHYLKRYSHFEHHIGPITTCLYGTRSGLLTMVTGIRVYLITILLTMLYCIYTNETILNSIVCTILLMWPKAVANCSRFHGVTPASLFRLNVRSHWMRYETAKMTQLVARHRRWCRATSCIIFAASVCRMKQFVHTSWYVHTVIQRTKTKFRQRALVVTGPAAWNSLPCHIRYSESVNSFKTALKTFLFSCQWWTLTF